MVRPRGSQFNKDLGLAFANVVTTESEDKNDKIARSGGASIFAVLGQVFPWAVRDVVASSRDGISNSEFNKVLEGNGFTKARAWLRRLANEEAGSYVFTGRRWRVQDPTECRALFDGLSMLMTEFGIHQCHRLESPDFVLEAVKSAQQIEQTRRAELASSESPSRKRGRWCTFSEPNKRTASSSSNASTCSSSDTSVGVPIRQHQDESFSDSSLCFEDEPEDELLAAIAAINADDPIASFDFGKPTVQTELFFLAFPTIGADFEVKHDVSVFKTCEMIN